MTQQEQLNTLWTVSNVFYGKSNMPLTVEQGIKMLTSIQKYCHPKSKMFERTNALLDDIIRRNIEPLVAQD